MTYQDYLEKADDVDVSEWDRRRMGRLHKIGN